MVGWPRRPKEGASSSTSCGCGDTLLDAGDNDAFHALCRSHFVGRKPTGK